MIIHLKKLTLLLISVMAPTYLSAAPVSMVQEEAVKVIRIDKNIHLLDFGKVTFGNLLIQSAYSEDHTIKVHFGEDFTDGRINRKPRGSVRYQSISLDLKKGQQQLAAPNADRRNTDVSKNAVLTNPEWGVIMPFRWVEIEGWKGKLKAEDIIRQSAYLSSWNDEAASFQCSDEMLNKIWKLSKDSIKATTFAGVYVDGDRERIPYEADAYLNQLSHYYTDDDIQMARDTYDYLMKHPTWPTEWASHMIFMAHADWMKTGDKEWVSKIYRELETKLFMKKLNKAGLVVSNRRDIRRNDIVDWPGKERDGYVFTAINTVVNAFHIRSLYMMSDLAAASGNTADSQKWLEQAEKSKTSFNDLLYSKKLGGYVDGVSTDHQSIHANLFPLAFGLVPEEAKQSVTDLLKQRDMNCSVYAAQYLLEALYNHEADEKAMDLMVADTDRSWKHMVNSGATITWEAWDLKYKPNQDWNHAWGAAPANIIPRFILGAEAASPGWKSIRIRPSTSGLTHAKGRIPTANGSLFVSWKNGGQFHITIESDQEVPLQLALPAADSTPTPSSGVYFNQKKLNFKKVGNRWVGEHVLSSKLTLTVK